MIKNEQPILYYVAAVRDNEVLMYRWRRDDTVSIANVIGTDNRLHIDDRVILLNRIIEMMRAK